MHNFRVEESNQNQRLDKFLAEKSGQPRNQTQKMIKIGLVSVNGKPAKAHQLLKLNDFVILNSQSEVSDSRQIKNSRQDANDRQTIVNRLKNLFVKNKNLTPKIIHRTKDYIIIDKPAGLLTHAAGNSGEPTLVDWLLKRFPKVAKIADSEALKKDDLTFRPGIVHRLDRDVSGIILIARTQAAFDYFKSQFKQRKIKKEYIALVHGRPAEDRGLIEFEISRKAGEGRMAAHPRGSGKGRPAVTEYEVVRYFLKATLVKAIPLTGRTNQIRAHFFALQHPIIGDKIYKINDLKSKIAADRIMLHARKITFTDLNGETKSFESPVPKEFDRIMATLKI